MLTTQIKETFLPLFGEAGKPVDMAVFTRSESEGRLHCEKPFRDGLGLLADDLNSWAAFFPEIQA